MVSILQCEHKYCFAHCLRIQHNAQKLVCLLLSLHDYIGAIDGSHVTARVLKFQSVAYRGRKHYTNQNVLVAVDFDQKFTYVLAGWEGSAYDASVLTYSLSRPDGIHLLDGKSYLGDASYAC
jgi:hypothetical protein